MESFPNSTNSSDTSPPLAAKSNRKNEKNEPKPQVCHELTQQTLRLEKPKVKVNIIILVLKQNFKFDYREISL